MSHAFRFNDPFDDFGHDIKEGIKEFTEGFRDFIHEVAEEAKTCEEEHGGCFGGGQHFEHGCFGGGKFDFRFDDDFYPRYNVSKKEDGSIVFEFLLPGFEETCIELSFKGDSMILKARLPESLRAKSGDTRRRRFTLRDIERREYPVPAERYDQAAAKAVFKNGILTVTVPSKEEDMSDAVRVEIIKEGN